MEFIVKNINRFQFFNFFSLWIYFSDSAWASLSKKLIHKSVRESFSIVTGELGSPKNGRNDHEDLGPRPIYFLFDFERRTVKIIAKKI